jgi:hypothetical protein
LILFAVLGLFAAAAVETDRLAQKHREQRSNSCFAAWDVADHKALPGLTANVERLLAGIGQIREPARGGAIGLRTVNRSIRAVTSLVAARLRQGGFESVTVQADTLGRYVRASTPTQNALVIIRPGSAVGAKSRVFGSVGLNAPTC